MTLIGVTNQLRNELIMAAMVVSNPNDIIEGPGFGDTRHNGRGSQHTLAGNYIIVVGFTYHIYSFVVLFVNIYEVVFSNVAMLASIEVLGEVVR